MFSNSEGPDQLHAGALVTQAWQQIVGCRHAVRQRGVTPMPLLRFDLIEGRSESDVKKILDVTHDVLIETLQVPKRDGYQVVHEHKESRIIVEKNTGLGFVRSDHVLLLQFTSRPRSREMKEKFYRVLVERLATRCGISWDTVIVNFVASADADWSYGAGRAQFLTGELSIERTRRLATRRETSDAKASAVAESPATLSGSYLDS